MLLNDARQQIADACSHLSDDGLVVGTAGNLSIREGDLLAITPSGLPYQEMRPDLVAVVEYATGKQVEGPLKPASELDLHLTALRATGQMSVVHTHSYAATTVASLEGVSALPAVHYYICMFGGSDVRVADYAIYGSPELAANVEKALEGRTAALMSNHGSVVTGPELAATYVLAQELEWVCELYLRTLAVGTPKILTDEQIEAAYADSAAIGLPAEAGGNVEGWLAPGTYDVTENATPKDLVKKMVSQTVTQLKELQVPKEDYQKVLTKASIVEREVNSERYYGQAARVIENRLSQTDGETHGLLQMDSTVQYGLGRYGGIPTEAETQDANNPYNTYVHKGLPPGPIGSPGEAAIKAVLNPPAGSWLYFVTVNLETGETLFASTNEEQKTNTKKLNDYCKKNQEICNGEKKSG